MLSILAIITSSDKITISIIRGKTPFASCTAVEKHILVNNGYNIGLWISV